MTEEKQEEIEEVGDEADGEGEREEEEERQKKQERKGPVRRALLRGGETRGRGGWRGGGRKKDIFRMSLCWTRRP